MSELDTSIALVRLPAAKPDQRIGSLFLNPGGPGASGVEFVTVAGTTAFSQAVRDRYDVIGFDPRAVGASDPAMCFSSVEEKEAAVLATRAEFPVTKSDTREYIAVTRDVMASCKANADERFSDASTANVARDLDLLRRAVGNTGLHYMGYPYGSFLGATYVKLFPKKVGPMVIDGPIDPDAYTGRNGDRRSVGARTGQGAATTAAFEQCLDMGGVPTVVDYPYAISLALRGMYASSAFAGVARFFTRLANAAASPRVAAQEPPANQAPYPSAGGGLAPTCVDRPVRIRPNQFERLPDAEDRAAPGFGSLRAWVGLECAVTRFVDRDAYRGGWKQTTKQNVLVVGTRYDPATPYSHAKPYAKKFPRVSLLTVEGFGHGTVGVSARAQDVVTTYLVEGETPRRGATCDQDVPPFPAAGVTAQEVQPTPLMPVL